MVQDLPAVMVPLQSFSENSLMFVPVGVMAKVKVSRTGVRDGDLLGVDVLPSLTAPKLRDKGETEIVTEITVAWQLAFVPPFNPWHVQFKVVPPLETVFAVPAMQRLVVGAEVRVWPLAEPHWPLTGMALKLALTVQLAVMGPVV